jgi:hypothetical protein
MSTFTMGENVFVLLDDPISPGRYDLQTLSLATKPTHLKSTYVTLSPPGALEQLLSHLRARWGAVRGQTTGPQLTIDGSIFSIGTDWIVRVGNVIMSSTGTVKGILLEVISLMSRPFVHPDRGILGRVSSFTDSNRPRRQHLGDGK